MKKLLNLFSLLFSVGLLYSQTPSENYIQTKVYLEPVTTSSSTAKQIQTVQYVDGLGRPKQVVSVKATPAGNDIVTPIVYDNFGLQTKNYLSIPKSSTSNGNIYPQNPNSVNSPVDDDTNFYQGEKIYSEAILEISPLNRIQQKKQEGTAWSSKPINFKYETNISSDGVKKYEVSTTWNPTNNVFVNSLPSFQAYQANQLYKSSIKDEDGNETITFKNKSGQIILTRKVLTSSENADTYYIYNIYDQLAYVIPPLASVSPTLDSNIIKNLCYQYVYDGKGRLVEKKLPGKDWEYLVYDKQNRLVLTQDAILRSGGQWLFTKYDQFSRPIYTGILNSTPGRTQQATAVDGFGSNNEIRTTSTWNNSGMDVYYTTSSAYPQYNFKLLSVNYYDTYPPYSFNPTFPTSVLTDNSVGNPISTNSLPVMNVVKNIEDDNWTKDYYWYDNKGRAIATHSINHLGGYTKTETELDFVGAPVKVTTKHKKLASDNETVIVEDFNYDNQKRLIQHWHKVNGNPKELLTENTYNALSQLTNKKVGNNLQSIDYTYNIRGWLTKVNDPQNLNGKLFGYEIKYQNPTNSSAIPKFNGNISEIDWNSANGSILRRYYYQYDQLDRLKDAIYEEPSTTVPPTNSYGESLTYDINGNIKTLKRFSRSFNNTPFMIDDLDYSTYNGNQLIKVSDLQNNSIGYPSGGNPISYDTNGNMINHLDKGITNINYNFLNLPSKVLFDSNNASLVFKYTANGTKILQTYTYLNPKSGIFLSTDTDYLDRFQYVLSNLQFYPTSEGYYDFQYQRYVYQYKDQVNNIRLAYYKGASGVTIDKETNYYPFGMEYFGANGTYPLNKNYNYGFQEQEKQEQTGWSSLEWRNYDPSMGRFFNIDPMAELQPNMTPFRFGFNNPVSIADPTGMYEESGGMGGDYYDDSDRGNDFKGVFDVNFHWSGESQSYGESNTLWDILRGAWGVDIDIRSGMHDAGQSQGDFAQDIANENFSEKEGNDGGPDHPFLLSNRNGEKVLEAKNTFLGRLWATLEPREWSDSNGIRYNVDSDGKIKGRRPLMGDVPLGPGGVFKGAGFLKRLPSIDATRKVHGALPRVIDLAKFSRDELKILLNELKISSQQRIKVTSRLGRDLTHGERQGAEQNLIKYIEKHLSK